MATPSRKRVEGVQEHLVVQEPAQGSNSSDRTPLQLQDHPCNADAQPGPKQGRGTASGGGPRVLVAPPVLLLLTGVREEEQEEEEGGGGGRGGGPPVPRSVVVTSTRY